MSNAWIRPVGPIIDHPMMQNYEFLVALNNVLAPPCFEELPMMLEMMVSGRNWVRSTPQNQFLVHQPQRALDPRERDPLERGLPPVRIRTSRPDVDHFENTSLGEPEAPPPADFRICRAQRAARRRYESTWFPANQAELNEIIEAENKERARKLEVEIELDKIFNEIRERKAKIPTAKAQLSKLAEAWALEEDEKAHHAYFTWKAGFVNAFKCSPSETRVWHIIAWHKGPTVPEDVLNAIIEIADLYTEISMLQSDFEEYDISIGNNDLIRFDSVEELLNDDEAWVQGHSSRLAEMGVGDEDTIEWFGEEFQHRDLTNGFCDYAPKGQGAKMAEHALANLKARRVRLCYSTKQEVAEVKLAVGLFVRKAEQVLSAEKTRLQAEDEGKPSFNTDMKAVAEACQTMVDCRVELNGLGKSKDKKQSN